MLGSFASGSKKVCVHLQINHSCTQAQLNSWEILRKFKQVLRAQDSCHYSHDENFPTT